MCHSSLFFCDPVNVSPELKRGRYQNTAFPALGLEANTKKCPKQNLFFIHLRIYEILLLHEGLFRYLPLPKNSGDIFVKRHT